MSTFQPLPLESFEPKKREMWDQLRRSNPDTNVEDLGFLVDHQIAAGYSDGMQFTNQFMERFTAEQVAITIIAHALCEAIINAILAIGLSSRGQEDLFPLLERSSLKDKWTVAPRTFLSAYSLSKSDAQYEVLSVLCKKRNALVHSKITLRNDDSSILVEGSDSGGISMDTAGRNWLNRFLRLPYDLHSRACAQIDDQTLRFQLEHLLSARRTPSRNEDA